MVGNFENAFYDYNFEQNHKIKEAQKVEDADLEDDRTTRLTKNAETYRLHVEDESIKTDEAYVFLMAMARAKEAS